MSLIDSARRVAAQAALDEDRHPADDADSVYVRAGLEGCQDARDALPLAALLDALGPAGLRRIQGRDALALVIEVPAPDWGTRVEYALRDLGAFAQVLVKTGASRLDRPAEGNGAVSAVLSRGERIAGVSQAPGRYLPATLVQAADMAIRIGPPSNRTIASVIRAVTGKRVRRMPPAVAAGLSFDDLTAAIRMGTSPASCIARLQASARALSAGDALGDETPDLASLHGYGDAMTFALALVRDLDEWRAGRLDFSRISKNCTLYSDPGLGKSTLVRSIAKAAKVPLVSASISELFTSSSGHLDGVLKAWEAKIAQAAAIAPSILFLDEIDSIPNRATMDNRGRDWWSPVVNGILASLDSTTSDATSKIIVIGATNHVNLLDAALIRPGRLHPVIRIERPDADALVGIMRQHLGIDLLDADLSGVAQLGAGSTGAEVTAWIKGARSLARAEGRRMVLADLIAQVAPAETRTAEEVRAIARHEAAHCVCAARLHVATMTTVTIAHSRTSEGAAMGIMTPRAFLTRSQVEHIAVVALAGRAMDALAGAPHTGAGGGTGSDLHRATVAVTMLHTAYGLGDGLAYRGGQVEDALRGDPVLRRKVEADLLRLYAQATDLVRENRGIIEALADRLVEARVLSGDEIAAIIAAGAPSKAHRRRGARHVAR